MKFNFSYFTPYVRLIFVEKENLKFWDSKIWLREYKKILTFVKRAIAPKIFELFRENNTEALVISKSLRFPLRMTEQLQIL